jgi:hypothetical protein
MTVLEQFSDTFAADSSSCPYDNGADVTPVPDDDDSDVSDKVSFTACIRRRSEFYVRLTKRQLTQWSRAPQFMKSEMLFHCSQDAVAYTKPKFSRRHPILFLQDFPIDA